MIWYENSLVGQWQVTRQLLIFLLLKSTLSGACTTAFLRYIRIAFSQRSYGHSIPFIMRQIEQGDNITIQDALIHIRWKGRIFVRNPEGSICTCQVCLFIFCLLYFIKQVECVEHLKPIWWNIPHAKKCLFWYVWSGRHRKQGWPSA